MPAFRLWLTSSCTACDAELLAGIALGDTDALGSLFARYRADVYRWIHNRGISAQDSDDLVQLTFIDVPHAARSFDGRASARGWLLGLAAMVVRRHRTSAGRYATKLAALTREPQRVDNPTPDALFEAREGTERVRRALERLPSKKRDAYSMAVLESASGEQIAHALGIPVATVWTRLHHARRDLRRLLQEDPQPMKVSASQTG